MQQLFTLPEFALIDMADFGGGMLKYTHTSSVPRVTIAGGTMMAARPTGATANSAPSRPSVQRTMRSSGQLARHTAAAGHSAP